MIIQSKQEAEYHCDKCTQSIKGSRIDWWFGHHLVHLHPACAQETARKMKSNVYRLYRIERKEVRNNE
jgi:hypothetical protein